MILVQKRQFVTEIKNTEYDNPPKKYIYIPLN